MPESISQQQARPRPCHVLLRRRTLARSGSSSDENTAPCQKVRDLTKGFSKFIRSLKNHRGEIYSLGCVTAGSKLLDRITDAAPDVQNATSASANHVDKSCSDVHICSVKYQLSRFGGVARRALSFTHVFNLVQ